MPFLEAKGLKANNPCDMLAALGLLRAWSCQWPDDDPKLCFHPDSLHARLEVPQIPSDWAEALVDGIRDCSDHLVYGDRVCGIIKCPRTEFRQHLQAALDPPVGVSQGWQTLPERMFAAYASELSVDKEDMVEPTPYSFSNGGGMQYLFGAFTALVENVAPQHVLDLASNHPDAWAADKSRFKRFRWDPSELRSYALMSRKPDDTPLPTRPAVNLFAFIGLSLLPVAMEVGARRVNKVRQPGTASWNHRPHAFRWPVWITPIGVDEVQTLLTNAPIEIFGAATAFQSRQITKDKSKYFLPATPVE